MTVTDEELMAYVDGELDAASCESLRQEIAASADLSRRVDKPNSTTRARTVCSVSRAGTGS